MNQTNRKGAFSKEKLVDKPLSPWRRRLHEIIFEAETPAGHAFDFVLIAMIFLSVAAVMLETVQGIGDVYRRALFRIEWALTILFTIEYVLRLMSVKTPSRYARSFYGIVDLLAIVPTYLSFFLPGTQSFLVVRVLRLLRLFRLLKLTHFVNQGVFLGEALRASRYKIVVFLGWVLGLVTILGAMMYLIEGPEHGFTSIPRSIYWAIITLTTVGYGVVTPQTSLGQMMAAFVMILGYCIIAVPTGIVSAELARTPEGPVTTHCCPDCSREGHEVDAVHCKYCGSLLHEPTDVPPIP